MADRLPPPVDFPSPGNTYFPFSGFCRIAIIGHLPAQNPASGESAQSSPAEPIAILTGLGGSALSLFLSASNAPRPASSNFRPVFCSACKKFEFRSAACAPGSTGKNVFVRCVVNCNTSALPLRESGNCSPGLLFGQTERNSEIKCPENSACG
jgi:hypothetical protein